MKNKFQWLLLVIAIGMMQTGYASPGHYEIVKDGVVVYPDVQLAGVTKSVKVHVITDRIIRVTASPNKEQSFRESLVVIKKPGEGQDWQSKEEDGKLIITTASLQVIVDIPSGHVSFYDKEGKTIIREKPAPARVIEPVVYEGESLYRTKQVFETTPDDSYYGLGQHQEDIFNYKGQQVLLFQNNTEVAVPFLVSSKSYGILWENYSLTKVGDTRTFQPLSALKLYDTKGSEGWLTASYSNDRERPGQVAFEKAESDINYAYLNDSKLRLPKEFIVEKGVVTWNGQLSSGVAGIHKLRFTYAGYIKVWIDGELLFDKWRQAWNPGAGVINKQLQENRKYNIKIEWIPDGTESYLTAGYLPPLPGNEQNSFAFDSEAGRQIDYYFVYGNNLDQVIEGYRELTGKAQIVPKWALGFWQSRERYKTQEEMLAVMAEYRQRKIPIDNIVLDWSYWKEAEWGSQEFDEARFPNPEGMISALQKKYNAKVMVSVWPKFYTGIPAYEHFVKKGWLYKRNVADKQRDWIGEGYVSTFYDAFNAEARKGFWDLIYEKLYKKGFDAWWMDASEPDILSNVSPEKRKLQMSPTAIGTAAEYLNAYPLQNAKGIYEGQRSVDNNKRVFLLTRSGFSGSQRYAATIWSGDIAARWEDMKAQISAGINFSLSGLPYWTMDIGGFSVEKRYEQPNETDLEEWRELLTRWHQFGAFIPLFRSHGQFPVREIYHTAPYSHAAYQSMVYYNKLRYRLLPYIYTLAGEAYHRDRTMMRALVFDFAKDTVVKNIGDQFMLGPSLLVNPVYTYKARVKAVYLPAGQGWYDFYTGQYSDGGTYLNADAPYEKMPLLVKAGSIIPAGPALQYTDEKLADPLTIYVYAGADGRFSLYEDEGINYNYETGSYATIGFTYNDQLKTLKIGHRQGSFKGMLKKRTLYIKYITPQSPQGIGFEEKQGKKISYTGKEMTIQLAK